MAAVLGPPFLRASASDVTFSDPAAFRAGSIHDRAAAWEHVVDPSQPAGARVLRWVRHGVDVPEFFRPFRGPFHGAPGLLFDSPEPPALRLPNHASCAPFSAFISSKLAEMVASGALEVLGPVGTVAPPHLCLPLGIEPAKPRLIHDAQFLNLWCHPETFHYDNLHMLPSILEPGDSAWTLDHVSGYHHVRLTPRSRAYFGIAWEGTYYVHTVLSFGWVGSCLCYNELSTVVSDYLRRLGIPNLVYLDDQIGGRLSPASPALARRSGCLMLGNVRAPVGALVDLSRGRDRPPRSSPATPAAAWPGGDGTAASHAAVFVACSVWAALGYFVQIHTKSVLVPRRLVDWLGVTVFTGAPEAGRPPSFQLQSSKRAKLAVQLAACSAGPALAYKDLERLAGRCASMYLVLPGCLLLTRAMYAALEASRRRRRTPIALAPDSPLVRELTWWRTLPDGPPRPWPSPAHAVLELWDVVYQTTEQEDWDPFLLREVEPQALALHFRLQHPSVPPSSYDSCGWVESHFRFDYPLLTELSGAGVPFYSVEAVHHVLRTLLGDLPAGVRDCHLDLVLSSALRPATILGSDLCDAPDFASWLYALASERGLHIAALRAPGQPYAFDVSDDRRRDPQGASVPSPPLPPTLNRDKALSAPAFHLISDVFERAGSPRSRVDLFGVQSRAHAFRSGLLLPSLVHQGLYRYGRPALSERPGGSLGAQALSHACAGVPLFADPPACVAGPLLHLLRAQEAGPVVVVLPCDPRAYWFSAVTLFGLAALVVARAGDPPPYELLGYALSAVPGTARRWPPSGAAGSGPPLPVPIPGPVQAWHPVSLPLPASTPPLGTDLLAVLFDFRPPASRGAPQRAGLGPFADLALPPPARRVRAFTHVPVTPWTPPRPYVRHPTPSPPGPAGVGAEDLGGALGRC